MLVAEIGKVQKMLTLAGHPSTPEREALTALRKARTWLDDVGMSFGDLTPKGGASAPLPSVLELMKRVESLEVQIGSHLRQIDRLTAENATLRKRALKVKAEPKPKPAKQVLQPTPKPEPSADDLRREKVRAARAKAKKDDEWDFEWDVMLLRLIEEGTDQYRSADLLTEHFKVPFTRPKVKNRIGRLRKRGVLI